MHRTLAVRVASPLLAASVALLASASLGANAMPAPVVRHAVQALEQATQSQAASSAAASAGAMRRASLALDWDEPSISPKSATLASAILPAATAAPTASRPPAQPAPVWWSRYSGANHVWIPTLGVSRGVTFYACSQTTYPANQVYRWGCGGTNNTYLFGHNFGVFGPLYQAWRNGTLRKGLPVVYADASGRTRLYRVVSWRVVRPTDTAWATASQTLPSMTLQTCADMSGALRLVASAS
ncbi:MAG TPA: sortase [Candidatus Binatus sp.]|nr:sortase [Candidatus Binatus sp.]